MNKMAKESKLKTNRHVLKNSGHDGTFLEGDERDEIQRNLYLVTEKANVMIYHLDEVFYCQASGGILKKTSITDPNHTVTLIASMSGNLNLNKDFRNL